MNDEPPPDFGKTSDVPFGDRLSALCAIELVHARQDQDRAGEMVERLANALGFTIAMLTKGDPEAAQNMLTAAEQYLYSVVAEHQPIADLLERDR